MSDVRNNPFLAEHAEISQAITGAMIADLPRSWQAAELRLRWGKGESGEPDPLTVELVQSGTMADHPPSPDLIAALQRLDDCRRRYRQTWAEARYGVTRNDANAWDVRANFH